MFDHRCFGLVFFIFFYFAIRFWLLSFGFFLRTFSTITSDGSQVCAGSRYRPSRLRSLIQVHGFGRGGKNVRTGAMPAWWLGHAPGAAIICATYAQDLSDKFARD